MPADDWRILVRGRRAAVRGLAWINLNRPEDIEKYLQDVQAGVMR
jgi:hypothetical protein